MNLILHLVISMNVYLQQVHYWYDLCNLLWVMSIPAIQIILKTRIGCLARSMHVHHPQLHTFTLKLILAKCFFEDTHNLIFHFALLHTDVPLFNIVSHEIVHDINVLCSFMLDWILSHFDCTGIVMRRKHKDLNSKMFHLLIDLEELRVTRCNNYIAKLNSWGR